MKPTQLYSRNIGLNNKVTSHRLAFDKETGVSALEDATDVMIDRTGEIVTRPPTRPIYSGGDCHSTWPVTGGFYFVEDRNLDSAIFKATVNSDGSLSISGMQSGLTRSNRVSYADLDDITLYVNGSFSGQLNGEISSPWPVSVWPKRDTTSPKITTPIGRHIDILAGRVLLAVGKEVLFTEYGLPGLVDDNEGRRRFEGRVIMIAAVESGAFISTDKAVYFVEGLIPRKWKVKKVLNYPAIEWGVNQEMVDPSFLGFDTKKPSVLFATKQGPAIGLPSGIAENLSNRNVTLPAGCAVHTGSILVVDETTVIQSGV